MARTRLLTPAALAVAAGLAVAPAARAELRILAPPDAAVILRSPVTLIGSGATGTLELSVNGKKAGGTRQSGKAFTASLDLAAGENVVLVKSGEESKRLVFTLSPKGEPARAFRYHDPVEEGECKACHPQGVGRTSPVTEAKLCNTCHDPKTGYRYLHGPLGTGQCSICHDPHGSANAHFLVVDTRTLCLQCHAQSRSQAHIESSGKKSCPECHNPHGSEKQFLLH